MAEQKEWGSETVALLKRLVGKGWSNSQIGRYMHKTSGQVAGKIHRLNLRSALPGRRSNGPGGPGKRKKRAAAGTSAPASRIKEVRKAAAAAFEVIPLPLPREYDVARAAVAVAVVDLERHHCRFPIARVEGKWRFCGLDRIEGTSYCYPHLARCVQPVATKARSDVVSVEATPKVPA